MANPQISDYIKQARENGMTDEQIKESLKTSGWSETDINEAFGGGSSGVSSFGAFTGKSALSGLLSKKILVIAVGAVVVGSGAYYLFSRDKDTVPQNSGVEQQNKDSQSQLTPGRISFACKNIFPDSDFTRIIGQEVSSFELDESLDLTVEGLILDCKYRSKNLEQAGRGITVTISILGGALGSEQAFNNTKKGFPEPFKGAPPEIIQERKKILEGLGADSFHYGMSSKGSSGQFWAKQDQIVILTSNKKYNALANVAVFSEPENLDTFKAAVEIIKVLDTDLDKY